MARALSKKEAACYADAWKKFLEAQELGPNWREASQAARTLAQLIVMGRGVLAHSTDGTGQANWGTTALEAHRGRRVHAKRKPLNERQVVYENVQVLGIGAPISRADASLLGSALTHRTETRRLLQEERDTIRRKREEQRGARALQGFADSAVKLAAPATSVR